MFVNSRSFDITMAIEVSLRLLWARLLCLLPMRWWSYLLGLVPIRSDSITVDPGCDFRALQRHLTAIARRVPWRADCLPQALVAMAVLRRLGHSPVLHLGARRETPRTSGSACAAMSAHAWVVCGEKVVIGGGTNPPYATVARMSYRT